MLELLKSIDVNNMSIRTIRDTLEDVREKIGYYPYDNECNENIKYNLYKIGLMMDKTDILELNYIELKDYINKLVILMEFTIKKVN